MEDPFSCYGIEYYELCSNGYNNDCSEFSIDQKKNHNSLKYLENGQLQ